MHNTEKCVNAYRKHKHLKKAADELGMKWQKLYTVLVAANEPVTGDKERYGSETDKFARMAEKHFKEIVPYAGDQNESKFQSKFDFQVGHLKVDIKCARASIKHVASKAKSWAFSVKKQRLIADMILCIGYGDDYRPEVYLLIPGEVARNSGTINLPQSRKGKWWDFSIELSEIKPFFDELVGGASKSA